MTSSHLRKGEFRRIHSCAQGLSPLLLPSDANNLSLKIRIPEPSVATRNHTISSTLRQEGTLDQGQIHLGFNDFPIILPPPDLAPTRCGSRPRPCARNPEPDAALPNMEPSRTVGWVVAAVLLAAIIGNALRSCEMVPIDTAP
jgi:hypothetical protein